MVDLFSQARACLVVTGAIELVVKVGCDHRGMEDCAMPAAGEGQRGRRPRTIEPGSGWDIKVYCSVPECSHVGTDFRDDKLGPEAFDQEQHGWRGAFDAVRWRYFDNPPSSSYFSGQRPKQRTIDMPARRLQRLQLKCHGSTSHCVLSRATTYVCVMNAGCRQRRVDTKKGGLSSMAWAIRESHGAPSTKNTSEIRWQRLVFRGSRYPFLSISAVSVRFRIKPVDESDPVPATR